MVSKERVEVVLVVNCQTCLPWNWRDYKGSPGRPPQMGGQSWVRV